MLCRIPPKCLFLDSSQFLGLPSGSLFWSYKFYQCVLSHVAQHNQAWNDVT